MQCGNQFSCTQSFNTKNRYRNAYKNGCGNLYILPQPFICKIISPVPEIALPTSF
jgi:hypothetical protein